MLFRRKVQQTRRPTLGSALSSEEEDGSFDSKSIASILTEAQLQTTTCWGEGGVQRESGVPLRLWRTDRFWWTAGSAWECWVWRRGNTPPSYPSSFWNRFSFFPKCSLFFFLYHRLSVYSLVKKIFYFKFVFMCFFYCPSNVCIDGYFAEPALELQVY